MHVFFVFDFDMAIILRIVILYSFELRVLMSCFQIQQCKLWFAFDTKCAFRRMLLPYLMNKTHLHGKCWYSGKLSSNANIVHRLPHHISKHSFLFKMIEKKHEKCNLNWCHFRDDISLGELSINNLSCFPMILSWKHFNFSF